MKILLITFFLALVLSTSVHAGKARIIETTVAAPSNGSELLLTEGSNGCVYTLNTCFVARVYANKNTVLAFSAITDSSISNIKSWELRDRTSTIQPLCSGAFSVQRGQDWELAWVLQRINRKGRVRVIDAAETFAGTCPAQ
jgi:hypothetical protein